MERRPLNPPVPWGMHLPTEHRSMELPAPVRPRNLSKFDQRPLGSPMYHSGVP
uniref:Uncharacterized protein n=1 Tax=Anguilla anguilla TaxID=7936 RepID=A0A0E9R923_ANGAN